MTTTLKVGQWGTCQAKNEIGLRVVGFGTYRYVVKPSEYEAIWVYIYPHSGAVPMGPRFECNPFYFEANFLFTSEAS